MKILCGTDFSEPAAEACSLAAQLVRRVGGTLLVAHVNEPLTHNPLELAADARRFETALAEAAAERLAKASAELATVAPKVEARLLSGEPEEALSEAARAEKADLIVVGTNGRRGPLRWLTGRVAERLIRLADRPVLAIRPRMGEDKPTLALERPLTVLVGIDLGAASEAAITWVRTLCAATRVDVTFVYAASSAAEPTREIQDLIDRELRRKIGELPGEGSMQVSIVFGPRTSAETLADLAKDAAADLIVVGTHKTHGLSRLLSGSSALDLLAAAPCPVVCVPAAPAQPRAPLEIPALRMVMVATDLSEPANHAIPYAYTLLRGTGGTVVLCHVRFPEGPARLGEAALTQSEIAARETELRALVPQEEALRKGITTHVCVVTDVNPVEAILATAQRLGVDALCLATGYRSSIDHALFGSVTEKLIATSPRPVFVVKA